MVIFACWNNVPTVVLAVVGFADLKGLRNRGRLVAPTLRPEFDVNCKPGTITATRVEEGIRADAAYTPADQAFDIQPPGGKTH
jgi:hypothetical protein